MNKQQTAVEWLLDRIEDVDNSPEIWELIKDKAKEMEKQQIIDAYEKGDKYKLEISGEQHYNQTFNK
jgi:spore coat polysaccharide biosynthesis protein SpsF (cytidylyltransferase family)